MLDVRLISVIAPSPAIGQPPAAQSVTTQGSAVLPQLPNGSILSGFIVNRDAHGNPILRTEQGDVTFSSNFFLKIGSEVVLRLQLNAGQQIAHLVTVNGLPPEIAEGQSGFSDEGDVIVGRSSQQQSSSQPQSSTITQTGQVASTSSSLPVPKTGQTISAIVVTPSSMPAVNALPGQPAPVPPGTSLLLTVLGVNQPVDVASHSAPLTQLNANTPEAPANALASLTSKAPTQTSPVDDILTTNFSTPTNPAAPNVPTTTATTAPSTTAPAVTTTASPQVAPTVTQPTSPNTVPTVTTTTTSTTATTITPTTSPALPTEAVMELLGQTAPFATSNQQAADAKLVGPLGQTMVATVLMPQEDGTTLLETPAGIIRSANMGSMQQGEQLTLRVSSVAPPNSYTIALANNVEALPPAPLTELARSWTSLQQIVSALGEDVASQIIPTFPAAGLVNNATPGQITQASSQILFFIAALKGGSFRDWIGSNHIRSLEEKGYSSLIRKAEGEFMQIARAFAEPTPGNWQATFFPVIAAGELHQLRAFFKREKKKNEQGKPTGTEDTRFVVEMDLSQLGEMQMDGLVKRKENALQFDLVIRSLIALPREVELDIIDIYNNTAEITGYRGQLNFQAVHAFPVHPMEDIITDATPDVIA